MDHLSGQLSGLAKGRGAAGIGLRFRTVCPETPQLLLDGVLRFRRHTVDLQLLGFSSLMRCGLTFGGPYSCEKRVRSRRSVHVARQCFCKGNVLSVKRLGGIIVLLDDGAIYRDSSKQAFGARVAQGLRVHLPVRAGRCMASNWAGSRRRFAAELELTGKQLLHACVVHEQNDKINRLNASLEAKIASTDRNE